MTSPFINLLLSPFHLTSFPNTCSSLYLWFSYPITKAKLTRIKVVSSLKPRLTIYFPSQPSPAVYMVENSEAVNWVKRGVKIIVT